QRVDRARGVTGDGHVVDVDEARVLRAELRDHERLVGRLVHDVLGDGPERQAPDGQGPYGHGGCSLESYRTMAAGRADSSGAARYVEVRAMRAFASTDGDTPASRHV